MLPETVIGLVGLAVLLTARLLYRWICGRTQVQLARLRQQGTSDRVRVLPLGSVLTERSEGEETRVEIGHQQPPPGSGPHGDRDLIRHPEPVRAADRSIREAR